MSYRTAISIIGLSVLLSESAWAQTYNPSAGGSPLSLLATPQDGVAYYYSKVRARALVETQKYAEAEPLTEQLARDYPRDPENWTLLGKVKSGLKKYAQAALAYQRAGPLIGWDLEFPNGYLMAASYTRLGDKRAALDMLRRMIFECHGFHRTDLYDWPSFASLKNDPEFLEIIGRPNTTGWTRNQGWAYDIDFLYNEVKRVNPDYRDKPLPAELTRRYKELKRSVPTLSDEEIFVGMNRMLAPLHQGHIVLWSPHNRFLPIRLYAFPEGIFIIDASNGHKDLIGSRVLALGTTAAEEALRRLSEVLSVDGDMQYLWNASRLAQTGYLKGLRIIDSVESVNVTVQRPGERSRTVTLTTLTTEPKSRQDKLVAPKGVTPPLFLRDLEQFHWELALPEHDALYVQVNNLVDDPSETLAQFGRRLWTVLEKTHPKNLIVDIRHNNGGTTQYYPELLRTLVAFSRMPGNQVYVLIGRRTYSAAGNLVTDLERLTDPIFVGEASSECCKLHGDPISVILPYSKVEGELTAVHWQLSTPSDHRREMSPEVPVQLTAEAYFRGQDPALEAIFRMIAARKAAGSAKDGAGW